MGTFHKPQRNEPNRHPGGQPWGGRFAHKNHAEPDGIDLGLDGESFEVDWIDQITEEDIAALTDERIDEMAADFFNSPTHLAYQMSSDLGEDVFPFDEDGLLPAVSRSWLVAQ